MVVNHIFCFDLPQGVQQLLCAAYGKGGDNHAAAPVKCPLQVLGQLRDSVLRTVM